MASSVSFSAGAYVVEPLAEVAINCSCHESVAPGLMNEPVYLYRWRPNCWAFFDPAPGADSGYVRIPDLTLGRDPMTGEFVPEVRWSRPWETCGVKGVRGVDMPLQPDPCPVATPPFTAAPTCHR